MAERRVLLAEANERDLTKLDEYRATGGYESLAKARAMEPQQVVEAFERELGCRCGETSADGKVTLRAVECAGGCGWGTVVSVDHRYREPVKADDVPAIVEELRGA